MLSQGFLLLKPAICHFACKELHVFNSMCVQVCVHAHIWSSKFMPSVCVCVYVCVRARVCAFACMRAWVRA